MPDESKATMMNPVITEALTWMAVLGCVQLALRHSDYTGPSADIARRFADALGHKLLDEGLFSPEEFALVMRDQMLAENTGRKP